MSYLRPLMAQDLKAGEVFAYIGNFNTDVQTSCLPFFTERVLSTSRSILSSARTNQYEDGPLVRSSINGRVYFINPNCLAKRIIVA